MIITEFFMTRQDGVNLYRTYSDQNLRLQCEQTGQIFDEVVNVEGHSYTYIETNEQIDPPMVSENGALEAVQILLGQWGEL